MNTYESEDINLSNLSNNRIKLMINNSCENSPVDSHVVSPFLWPHNNKLGASSCTNRFACACKLSVFSYTFLEIEIFNQGTYEYLILMKIGFLSKKSM